MHPRAASLLVLLSLLAAPAAAETLQVGDVTITPALGGETSRPGPDRNAFALPAANLERELVRVFFFGNRLFNTNWIAAPSSTEGFDGLGPLFNRVSCSGCHLRDGRGQPPGEGEEMLSMLVRLSLPGQAADGGPLPHPAYGDQLSDRALPGVLPEGRATVAWEELPGTYADGTPYSLRRPLLSFHDLAYGPLDGVLTSPRVAPFVIGLGLLEAVAAADIVARADPDDRDGDGISGRPNTVWDAARGEVTLGRFGWKANEPTIAQQIAGAFLDDIGITTPLFAAEACTPSLPDCASIAHGGAPEIDPDDFDKVVLYASSLAVPARRDWDSPEVRRGQRLFHEAGCAACHTPTLTTGAHPTIAALSNQVIHPYTDLLLHDMGEGLADGRADFVADGREWRTPPLWGLGLIETVNGHTQLLHDGRARTILEAILWHGGEAEAARDAFAALAAPDREAVVRFLNTQ